ncbi:MAG: TAXI family TRAP transporter solute-binding subunit [Rhodocyclaceae bacterium]|nr:TAXI family TRAP transporter solute-binding subunit [Rhodocyclaceae bacterium]
MKSNRDRISKRLSELSPRDLLVVGLPLLLLLAAGFWGAAQFIRPAPPDTLVLSSGGEGGAYQRFASAYKDVLVRYGVRLVEKPSAGSLENLQRLRDGESGVDAGFFQAGTGQAGTRDALVSLGSFYYEPLWIFYRQGLGEPDRILQLKGRRIAIGGPGSGTHHLALEMLGANGLDGANTRLLEKGGLGLVDAFGKGEIDAAFVVGPTASSTVWSLLFTPGVRLMSLAHADAYTRRLPHLSKVVLPRGAVDMMQDLPSRDVTLVASTATLLVREDMHPALVDLLLEAAIETHGGAGIFQKPGDFPRATAVGFPLSKEAERYYKSGKPFFQRYLPFWAATLVDRMVVMLIPLIALLLPVFKFAPSIYSWRVRSRIYRRYGELKFIEAEVESDPARHTQAEWLERLDAIEADANRIPTPLAFADMLYTLKGHIGLVRETVLRRTA